MTHTPYKTMGFCATCERYTEHVCAKCRDTEATLGASHDTAMLPRVDLALVAEVQDLRAENAALSRERDEENRQKRNLYGAWVLTLEQLAMALKVEWEGQSAAELIEMVQALKAKSECRNGGAS